jgi:hypothetical protein
MRNLGFDANILKCYEACKTDFLWILSDDDSVIPNAIGILLSILDSSHIICLNDLLLSGEFGLKSFNGIIELTEYDRWEAMSQFVWISRFVVKKEFLEHSTLKQFLGTGLIHLGIINQLFLLKGYSHFKVTDFAVLRNQPHCVFSHNFINVFVNKFYDFCMLKASRFSNDLALQVARANFPFVVNGLLEHKIGSKVFNYEFKFFYLLKKMFKYKCNYGLVLKFMAIYILPTMLIRIIIKTNNLCVEENEKRTYI